MKTHFNSISRLLLGLVMIAATGCERLAESKSRPLETNLKKRASDQEKSVPNLDIRWQGVCLAHSWENDGLNGYGTDASAEAIARLAQVGTNAVSITPFGFMESLSATRVRGEHDTDSDLPGGLERSERVRAVTKQAHDAEMRVVLKPHIWIRGGEWRGRIKPGANSDADWSQWWSSYREFIAFWAKIAQEAEIDSLVIGVELASALERDPQPFIELIAETRELFDGHISYAANWNEPVPDEVWRTLDSVGVQFYPPISEKLKTTPEEMRTMLRARLDEWDAVASRVERPLVLTEVGYRSANSAARYPFAWPEKSHDAYSKPDAELQAQAYRALVEEVSRTPTVEGMFIWKYFTNKDTDEEGPDGFSPRGKAAERILSDAYGGELNKKPTSR